MLLLSNYIYKYTQWPKDRVEYADLLDSLDLVKNNTDILYLSSSSNYFYPKTDTSKKWISAYLNDFFPDKRINAIHKGYMHAGIFLSILKNIPENTPIETIVVSVNIRSLGAFWIYSDVETAYASQQLIMNQELPVLLRRFFLALGYYDNKTKEEREQQFLTAWENEVFTQTDASFPFKNVIEWDKAVAKSGKYTHPDGSWDMPKLEYACNLVKAFAFEVDSLNPRVQDFDKIVDYCKSRNWNLVFHILPEDVGNTRKLIGKELNHYISNTADYLFERYQSKGVNIVNNYNLLDNSYFYESYPTEHYSSYGKLQVAASIAQQLKQYYSESYKNIKIPVPNRNTNSLQAKIQEKIQIIKSDSVWFQNIKNKAVKNNISVDKQLELDAKWLIDKE